MEPTTSLLALVMVMVAAIATLIYDLLVNLGDRRPEESARPASRVRLEPEPPVRATAAAPAPAATSVPPAVLVAGVPGDLDPVRELSERLAALRLLGLDHLRATHPLFRNPLTPPTTSLAAPSLVLREELPEPPRSSARGRRRRAQARLPRPAGASPLRLVVDRREPLQ